MIRSRGLAPVVTGLTLLCMGCSHVSSVPGSGPASTGEPVAAPADAKQAVAGAHPEVVQAGDPVLRAVARDVDVEEIQTPAFKALMERMIRVMRESPGVGLAAPQIGVPLRVFVLEDRREYLDSSAPLEVAERERVAFPVRVFVNPVLVPIGTRTATFFEGCLSVAGYAAVVERAHEVEVRGLDAEGQPQSWRVQGWPARILQHEFDHLDGTLYVDRMFTRSFMTSTAAKQRFAGRAGADVLRELGLASSEAPRSP